MEDFSRLSPTVWLRSATTDFSDKFHKDRNLKIQLFPTIFCFCKLNLLPSLKKMAIHWPRLSTGKTSRLQNITINS